MGQSTYVRRMILHSLRQDLRWVRICIQLDLAQDGRVTDAREEIRKFQEQLMLAGVTHVEKQWLKRQCAALP